MYAKNSTNNRIKELKEKLEIAEMPEERIDEYLKLRQARDISIIKSCIVAFTVLAAINLAIVLFPLIIQALK